MNSPTSASPYVGLRPFREEEFPFFFGRDREIRVISSNLQVRPLTVLYGASGVGKSSVLQAGVVRHLKDKAGTSVLYFRDWQSNSLLEEVVHKTDELIPSGTDIASTKQVDKRQDAKPAGEQVFLLLDQFEEFLLYHAGDELGEAFDSVLARIVNRKDCAVNVLIGIRDDSLFKLDRRFSIRMPNLLRDTLEIERLVPSGARSAVEEPLRVFSQRSGDGKVYGIEPALVDEVLRQVQAGQVALSESSGAGARRGLRREERIETAYLQLVLTKLWQEEHQRNSTMLRLATLKELGGADNIVRSHVNAVMSQLANNSEREIAAKMFRYLVTPSRSKIAQATTDLISYAEGPEAEVKAVLNALTDRSESRILRRLSDPEQYEIFHDVLAQPLLDWRRTHSQAEATKRLWMFIAGASAVAILLAILAIYAFVERQRAKDAAAVAHLNSLKVEESERKVQQALAELKAKDAALAGNKAEAERFRAQADAYAKQATSLNESYQSQRQSLDVSNKQALEALNAANHARDDAVQKLTAVQKERDAYKSQLQPMQLERDDALQRLTAVQKERDSYKSQLEAAQQQLREFQKGSKAMSGPSRKSSGGSEPSPPQNLQAVPQ